MPFQTLPRVRLAHLPTPLEEARALSSALGDRVRILIKRDDATGLALGGNKARKLEFLVADALGAGADTLITTGGPQSNHARMTVAAARRFGLEAVLVLTADGDPEVQGNLLLDRVLGARVIFVSDEAESAMSEVAEDLCRAGRRPYIIPVGGSTPVGALGYVAFVQELAAQAFECRLGIDHIVLASGSGGTQAGLVAGTAVFPLPAQVTGISVSRDRAALAARVADIASEAARLAGSAARFGPDEIRVYDEYIGPGYARVTPGGLDAIRLVARTEGIILDPVYTGKAMAGLIDLVQRGVLPAGSTVVFVHTGGAPGLFAFAEHF